MFLVAPEILRAEFPDPALGEEIVPVPTMGGVQFWTDEFFFHQWHIQRNALNDQCRLLDAGNYRYAAGTFAQCRAAMEKIKRQRKLPPMEGKAVIVLHGLGRSHASMETMAEFLRDKGKYTVFNFNYSSTRHEIAHHAKVLAGIIDQLEGIEEIHLVAHSLGNIVVRHYLGDQLAKPGGRLDPRLGRFVMLGPPNTGSLMASALGENELFALFVGQPGQQLGRRWAELRPRLAVPPMPFGIIAGGQGNEEGLNPMLPGDDDGVVTVESTRLTGAADFMVFPLLHTFLVDDQQVMQCTVRFLQEGYFVSAEARRPVK